MKIICFKKRMSIGFAAIFCAMLLTTGCVEKEVKSSHDFSAWKVKAEQLKGYTPVDVADKDVPPGKLPLDLSDDFKPKEFQEKTISSRTLPTIKVSMEMKDVPVDVVIRTLAKAGHVNIIISKNITGITDLNIDAVPWNQVFESILKTFGYDYEWIGDIIRVISTADINNDVGLMEARQSMQLKQREHDLTMLALKSKADGLEPLETIIIPIRYIGSEDLKPLRDNLYVHGLDVRLLQAGENRLQDRLDNGCGHHTWSSHRSLLDNSHSWKRARDNLRPLPHLRRPSYDFKL